MYLLLPLAFLIALTGCKSIDQIVKTGQDLIGIIGETAKDVKDGVDAAKKIVTPQPAEVPKP